MENREMRDALKRHWAASDANDFVVEHEICGENAVLYYPQSGESIRGRSRTQESRKLQPSEKRFACRRIVGDGNLWVTEFVLSYDGAPSHTLSILEFSNGKIVRKRQYFGDPFKPGPSRAHLVELKDQTPITPNRGLSNRRHVAAPDTKRLFAADDAKL